MFNRGKRYSHNELIDIASSLVRREHYHANPAIEGGWDVIVPLLKAAPKLLAICEELLASVDYEGYDLDLVDDARVAITAARARPS